MNIKTIANMAYTSNVWVLKNYFKGEPKLSDFVLKEETLPAIKDGGNYIFL